jgi:LPXTG-motif cell wall-anchored protein
VGVIIAFGFLLLLSIVGYYYVRRRRRQQMRLLPDEAEKKGEDGMEMVRPTSAKPGRPPSL